MTFEIVPIYSHRRARRRVRRIRAVERPLDPGLTAREREICELAALAWCNKEIAVSLRIAEQTVKNTLCIAYGKIGITTRGELMRYWAEWGHALAGAVERRAA